MWYYHRDSGGREWGPFTPGQLTKLLNLDVLNANSLIRADSDETWHSYYAKPQPKDWFALEVEEDFEAKLAEGDQTVEDLQRYTARRRSGNELPWEDVDASRRNHRLQRRHSVAEAKDRYLPHANRCPACKTLSEALKWVYFSSPKETSPALCGCAGWVVVCDDCRIQVDFFIEIMS
ncbi:MAG TPA: hypothetical protein VK530_12120 [Candidatus Acidoferrum sp.]|nr:hypothetical protein [Candidatus Acidoferrum sp.]